MSETYKSLEIEIEIPQIMGIAADSDVVFICAVKQLVNMSDLQGADLNRVLDYCADRFADHV